MEELEGSIWKSASWKNNWHVIKRKCYGENCSPKDEFFETKSIALCFIVYLLPPLYIFYDFTLV